MVWFNPDEHGTLENFIKYCIKEKVRKPCFKGIDQFNMLFDKGLIVSKHSILSLAYGIGSDDCYLIINRHKLKGIDMNFNCGKPGIHNIENILTPEAPYYSISNINCDMF